MNLLEERCADSISITNVEDVCPKAYAMAAHRDDLIRAGLVEGLWGLSERRLDVDGGDNRFRTAMTILRRFTHDQDLSAAQRVNAEAAIEELLDRKAHPTWP